METGSDRLNKLFIVIHLVVELGLLFTFVSLLGFWPFLLLPPAFAQTIILTLTIWVFLEDFGYFPLSLPTVFYSPESPF